MADDQGEIGWYRADPRPVLPLHPFHTPRRLRRALRRSRFAYSRDRCFEQVIRGCADREQTWLSDRLISAYLALHRQGFAHSVEVWRDGELVGGLYGVHLGGAFFGESAFGRVPDAAKAAMVHLGEHLERQRFELLEIQMVTPLTSQFAPELLDLQSYTRRLAAARQLPCSWEPEP